jgi:hypothetical protein
MKPRLGLALVIPALAFVLNACNKPAGPQPVTVTPVTVTPATKDDNASEAKPGATADSKAIVPAATNSSRQVLVFRNVRSWNRKMDFEEALTNMAFEFEVKSSAKMGQTELAPYLFVIIPGAQWRDNFYRDYAENEARFERYVTNGGTLLLELNGAENDGILLPGGLSLVKHGARINAITMPDHPIVEPLAGRPIHASYASHGYLVDVPKGALVLMTEMNGEQPVLEKPTFVEYVHGKGRVIAACQCFHDQDGSQRGPLMATALSYAAERDWFSPKK